MDDLYGKVLGAVKKHWELKYEMSEEEQKAFAQQLKFEPSFFTTQNRLY